MKKYFMIIIYIFLSLIGITSSYLATRNNKDLANHGVVDENSLSDEIVTTYYGEWELYYNKLIVTDNIDVSSTKYDALIKLPNSWNNLKTVDGIILPISGYATYRLVVNNLHEGDIIKIDKKPVNASINVYINKHLIAKVGDVKKESFTANTYYSNLDEYKVLYNEQIEILIEVGYNTFGGIIKAPSFTTTNFKDSVKEIEKYASFILLFFFFGLFLVELVSYFNIYDSTMYTVNSVTCIFLLFLFSPTINYVGSKYFFILPFVNSIFNFIFYSLFLFIIYQFIEFTYNKKISLKEKIIYSIIVGLSVILYITLQHWGLHYISFIIITILFIILMIKATYISNHTNSLDATFYFTMMMYFSIIGLEITIISSSINSS